MLTLPIVVGKKYVRRDGVVVEAKEAHADINTNCVYVGREEEAICEGFTHAYIDTGKIWAGERGGEDSNDLVADYIESHEIKSREQKSPTACTPTLPVPSWTQARFAPPSSLEASPEPCGRSARLGRMVQPSTPIMGGWK